MRGYVVTPVKWFSVQTHFRIQPGAVLPERGQTYEERITIWLASSADEAAQLGEAEADDYASENGYERLDYLVAFELFDDPTAGKEVWSYVRESSLEAGAYLQRYVIEGDPDPVPFE